MGMEHKIEKIDIEKLESRLIEAIQSSDLSFLDTVLHDDLKFVAPNGLVVTKQMDLESHRNKSMVVESIESTIEDIQLIADTAIVVVVYDTKGVMLGNPIEGRFRYLRIWKRIDGHFKIIAGSSTKI